MAQQFIFKGEKPERLNIELLKASVSEVAPEVALTFRNGINWERFPYTEETLPAGLTSDDIPEDRSQPWQEPDVLIFDNVPEQYTREQVKRFILNHVADKTDDELMQERPGNKAIDAILKASHQKLQELKNALANI